VCFPDIARCLAQDGRLPLHYAAMKQAGAEAVAALLQANPDAASKADRVRSGGDLGCCASIVCSRVLQYVYTYINTNVYI